MRDQAMEQRANSIKILILCIVIALTFGYATHWGEVHAVEIPDLIKANRIGFYVGNPDAEETIAIIAPVSHWVLMTILSLLLTRQPT